MVELQKIATEQRNPNTMHIDTLSTLDMVKLINQEDHRVAEAVAEVTDKIAQAIDIIADRLAKGGRLIYCGAGTSGRLGILDAVECPPTYSTEPEMVQALMAGGYPAIFKAVEGAEDSKELGVNDLKNISFGAGFFQFNFLTDDFNYLRFGVFAFISGKNCQTNKCSLFAADKFDSIGN